MKDNKNIAIVDTTDIKHIIDELRLLNTDILAKLVNKDKSFHDALNKMNNWLDLRTKVIQQLDRIGHYLNDRIENNEQKLTNTFNLLAQIEKPLTIAISDFNELTKKIEDNEFLNKYLKNLNSTISLVHNNFRNSINNESDSTKSNINSKFEVINKSLENNMKKIMEKINSEFVTLNRKINKDSISVDAERLTNLNNSISKSLKNINTFNDSVKKLQKQYFILIAVSSFFGGVLISSTLIWLIINKL